VICPECGEDNSDNFRFCGMCGTLLEARRPAGTPTPNPALPVPPKIADAPESLHPLIVNATRSADKNAPSIGGPSVRNQPNMDSRREKSFSGLDSFFEKEPPEQPKTGGRRILLLVALLAALGVAVWWTYTNYLGAMESRKPAAAASSAGEAPAGKPSTKPAPQESAPANEASSSQAVAPSAGIAEGQAEKASEKASTGPEPDRKAADAKAKPEAQPAAPQKIALAKKSAENRGPRMTSAKPSQSPVPAAADTGDAAFRKGEAYLYGRGVPKNCDEAVKYLKTASAKSNAKARSAFGTMYATGHCVPRDLPTSYLWFALALRVDPNNQILEKDLSAIWNQMTPPERQMATRMKQ